MSREKIVHWFQKNWGVSLVIFILLLIIAFQIKPGYIIMGNDNFSPELDPKLTVERSITSAAWRTYRVLGIPSDSEQVDVFRGSLYLVLSLVFPAWVISQAYLFFTFFIASFSVGKISQKLLGKYLHKPYQTQLIFLISSLIYLSSMLTAWIYFFPVHLFVAAYAFLPFVIWRLITLVENPSLRTVFLLLVSALLLSTSALTATMFFIGALVIVAFGIILFIQSPVKAKVIVLGLGIVFFVQAYWFLPFVTYVKSNTKPLQDSAINRDITTTTIENEAKYNTALDTLRYFSSWMDTKENNITYSFPYRDWYKTTPVALILSLIPLVLSGVGIWIVVVKKYKPLYIVPLMLFVGWFMIKGINPPLGYIFEFMQEKLPVVAQVFRWQSSKLWPFLALSIPMLSAIGAVYSVEFFLRFRRMVGYAVVGGIVVGLLGFVYPFFTGHLIRSKSYVKVPQEYFDLASFLKKNDPQGRIYLSPEANTLYFRNYAWGFWGSVVLNYMLPNPLIEKALIIGSSENEQAFTVMNNAYYSLNPTQFNNALGRYNTQYVLSDRYASTGDAGYAYNWAVEDVMVDHNPGLSQVWHKGKLTLYKVNSPIEQKTVLPLISQTNYTLLNTILSSTGNTKSYASGFKNAGTIFPFALASDSLEVSGGEIVSKTAYKDQASTYTYSISSNDLQNAPVQLNLNTLDSELSVSPLLPYLQINSVSYRYNLPQKKYTVKDPAAFVSINDQVIDERSSTIPKTNNTLFKDIDSAQLRLWKSVFEPYNLLTKQQGVDVFYCNNSPNYKNIPATSDKRTKCGSSDLFLSRRTILEFDMRIKSDNPAEAFICVESKLLQTCLNNNISMFVNGVGETKTLIPQVLIPQDTIKIYVDFQAVGKKDAHLTFERLALNTYQASTLINLSDETKPLSLQSFVLDLKPYDVISFHIPILEGANSFPLRSDGVLIPESTTKPFDEKKPLENKIEISKQNGLVITNTEGNISVFPKLTYLDPRGSLALVSVSGKNQSGIPLEVSLRDINQPYKIWSRKLYAKKPTSTMDIFMMPDSIQSYYLEAFSTGIGPRPSINTIDALIFQIIPKSWYSLVLEPMEKKPYPVTPLQQPGSIDTNSYEGNVKNSEVATIPTAVSPNWILNGVDGQRVLVNGWQQGWVVGKDGQAKVTFWPNLLVYLGFVPLLGIIGWLLVKAVKRLIARFGKS